MHFSKKLLAASVLAALSTSASAVSVSGNYGMTSDYIWRGMTQGNHASAVFGGVDWDFGGGLAAGIWQSGGVGGSNETDFYAGYGMDLGGVGLEVGFIAYKYFSSTASDFNEIYVSADLGAAGIGAYIDSANDNTYISLTTELSGVGLELGMNTNSGNSNSDYTYIGASYGLSDDVSMGFYTTSGNAAPTDPMGFTLTYSKSFDM